MAFTKLFTEDTWIICHGPEHIHVVAVTAGDTIGTGQPNVEEFDTLEECYEFARALGWIEPAISPLPESEWPEGFVPNLNEDGMQLCYDTEPLWLPKPGDSVIDVDATTIYPDFFDAPKPRSNKN